MPVYISLPYKCKPDKNWPHNTCCDMIADTDSELIDMAEKLGINEFAFQIEDGLRYYRITENQRFEALEKYQARICPDDWFGMKFLELKRKARQLNCDLF